MRSQSWPSRDDFLVFGLCPLGSPAVLLSLGSIRDAVSSQQIPLFSSDPKFSSSFWRWPLPLYRRLCWALPTLDFDFHFSQTGYSSDEGMLQADTRQKIVWAHSCDCNVEPCLVCVCSCSSQVHPQICIEFLLYARHWSSLWETAVKLKPRPPGEGSMLGFFPKVGPMALGQ